MQSPTKGKDCQYSSDFETKVLMGWERGFFADCFQPPAHHGQHSNRHIIIAANAHVNLIGGRSPRWRDALLLSQRLIRSALDEATQSSPVDPARLIPLHPPSTRRSYPLPACSRPHVPNQGNFGLQDETESASFPEDDLLGSSLFRRNPLTIFF